MKLAPVILRADPPINRPVLDDQQLGGCFEEVRFAADSPLEGDGFEPSVPRPR
jgi:hypothetical protein